MTGKSIALAAATAVPLYRNSGQTVAEVVLNPSSAIYLGGPDVTNANYGANAAAAAEYRVKVAPHDTLYGYIVAGGTCLILASPSSDIAQTGHF